MTKKKQWWEEDVIRSGADVYADIVEFEKYKQERIDLQPNRGFYEVGEDGFLDFNFHPGQSKVMMSVARFIVALAGRQGGKSECAAPWLHMEMRSRGPGLYMVVAPSYPILFDSVYPKIVDFFDLKLNLGKARTRPFSFIISKEGEEELFRGTQWEKMKSRPETVIRFCHAQDAASLEAKTALACVFDEAGQNSVKREAIEAIQGRLTTTLGRLLMTTTPYSTNFLYEDFYKPWKAFKDAGKKHPDIDVIQFRSTMNPAFPQKEYERLKGTMPAWKHAMFYDGEFTRPAGQIYDCFDEDRHTCPPFKIKEHWPRYLGMDFGGNNTAGVFIAYDPDENMLYLYRTYKAGHLTAKGHVPRILGGENMTERRWSNDDWPDRATGGNAGESAARMEFREAGLFLEDPFFKNGPGSYWAGVEIVYGLISSGRFKIFNDQQEIISDLMMFSHEIDPESGDPVAETVANQNSWHHLDSLRYIAPIVARMLGTIVTANSNGSIARTGGRVPIDPRYSQRADEFRKEILGQEEPKILASSAAAWGALGTSAPLGLPLPFGPIGGKLF